MTVEENKNTESKLAQLNDYVDARVEERTNAFETSLADKIASISVQTEDRTSKWTDYEPGKGTAYTGYVEAALRSVQKTGRIQDDLTSYTDDAGFAKRFLERAAPIAVGTDGGQNTLNQPLHQEIVALLRKKMILDQLGISFMPMTTRTLDIPTETESSTYGYTNESATITESQYDAAQKQLVAKKLAGRVGVTNDFLAMNPVMSAQWIANKMIEDYAQALQKAVIEGLAGGPQTLFAGIAAGNKFELTVAAGQATSLTEYLAKIDDCLEAVNDVNVNDGDIRILTSMRHRNFLRRQRMSGGGVYFPEVRDGEFGGYSLSVASDVGNAYDDSGDTDGDETRVFVGDFSTYTLGVLQNAKLDFSEHSRFAKDEAEFRLVGHNDGIVTSPKRLAVLSTDISS